MAYRIGRSLIAVLAAYLLAGFAAVVIQESGKYGGLNIERFFIEMWNEIQCYLSSKRACCLFWGSSLKCPLTRAYVAACFAGALTIVPVAVMMWLVRRYNWDRPFSEILVGAALGSLAAVLTTQIPNSDGPEGLGDIYPSLELLPYVVPGMIGGFTYWLVAGRPKPASL